MKQTDLAKKVGVSQTKISFIVNGVRRPSWPEARRLARATGTSPLLWLEGRPEQIKGVLKGRMADPFAGCLVLESSACGV
jgi:transcriptional regulator with XRE-family HTH domain